MPRDELPAGHGPETELPHKGLTEAPAAEPSFNSAEFLALARSLTLADGTRAAAGPPQGPAVTGGGGGGGSSGRVDPPVTRDLVAALSASIVHDGHPREASRTAISDRGPFEPLPALLEPMPTAISRPSRADEVQPPEASWPAIAMGLALAAALGLAVLLIARTDTGTTARTTVTTDRPSPIIWTTGQVAAAPQIAVPRLQSGPAVTTRAERETVAIASTLIAAGDIESARLLLQPAADNGGAEAKFALAETYDPNIVTRWGLAGVSADPDRARELYLSALALGQDRARQRLSALD